MPWGGEGRDWGRPLGLVWGTVGQGGECSVREAVARDSFWGLNLGVVQENFTLESWREKKNKVFTLLISII